MAPETSLQYVEMPLVLPKGTTKRQWRLAALRERVETAYEALIAAGYAHSTATQNAKSQLETVGVQRAKAAQDAAKRDSGRSIHRSSLAELSRRITSEARDELILGAVKVTGDLVASGIDTGDDGIADSDRESARAYISKLVHCTADYIASKVVSDNLEHPLRLSAQDVEAIVLAAETVELTNCTFPDAGSPPTTDLTVQTTASSTAKRRR